MCLTIKPAPKCHFISKLPSWSPKIPEIGTFATLKAHNFMCKPLIELSFKQSCNPCQDFFNNMLHANYTQGNQGDSWLLVVESQIDNLICDPSFCHNLCFKYSNGSCKPVLDIIVPIAFKWYKEFFCRNPSFGLATKAKGLQGCGPRGSPGVTS